MFFQPHLSLLPLRGPLKEQMLRKGLYEISQGHPSCTCLINNYLITESEVITGKCQTEA